MNTISENPLLLCAGVRFRLLGLGYMCQHTVHRDPNQIVIHDIMEEKAHEVICHNQSQKICDDLFGKSCYSEDGHVQEIKLLSSIT